MWDNRIFWNEDEGTPEGGSDTPKLGQEIAESRIIEIEQLKATAEEIKKINELLGQQLKVAEKKY